MSNKDFTDKSNPLFKKEVSKKEANLRNLKAIISAEKCLKQLQISINVFLESIIKNIFDKKKIPGDNEERINFIKAIIENFISSMYQHVISHDYGFNSKFKLFLQQYDSNGNSIYDIGYGSSNDANNSIGNLPELSPFKYNYELINGIQSYLFTFPGFTVLYDDINISLSIKYSDINNNQKLENLNKKQELILNLIPDIGEYSWKVFNIFDNLANYQFNVFQFEANDLSEGNNYERGVGASPPGNIGITYRNSAYSEIFNIIVHSSDILNNLDSSNWGNNLTLCYPDDNIADVDLILIGHELGHGPNSSKDGVTITDLMPVTFYFKATTQIQTDKKIDIKINLWDLNSNYSLNYYNIQKEILESNNITSFLDTIDNKFNVVSRIRENFQ